MELLVPVAANTEGADITEVSLAALALGMAFVGTCNDEVTFIHLSHYNLWRSVSDFICCLRNANSGHLYSK